MKKIILTLAFVSAAAFAFAADDKPAADSKSDKPCCEKSDQPCCEKKAEAEKPCCEKPKDEKAPESKKS